MLKVILFVPSLVGGGAERMMVNLANGFTSRGYDTTLLVVRNSGVYYDEVDSGVEVVCLNKKSTLLSVVGVARAIKGYLSEEKEVAMISTLVNANIVNSFVSLLLRRKYFSVLREANTPSLEYSLAGNKKRLVYILGKMLYKYSDSLVGVSKGVTNDAISFYGLESKMTSTIYNPVFSDSIVTKANLKPTVSLEGVDYIICAMGRVVPSKGFHDILKIIPNLEKRLGKYVGLIIIGDRRYDKKYNDYLTSLIQDLDLQDKVLFSGFQSNPFAIIKRSSVFVLSSQYEGLPGSLIQAMAVGTKVVSYDCPSGPKEILSNGVYGSLVTPGNLQDLEDAVYASLNSEITINEREMLICRAKSFDFASSLNGYIKVLMNAKE